MNTLYIPTHPPHRNAGVLALARRAAEACFLLRILSESNLPRLAARCSEGIRSRLTALKFRDLVTSSEGEGVAAQLVSTLVGQHMTSVGGRTEDLAGLLQVGKGGVGCVGGCCKRVSTTPCHHSLDAPHFSKKKTSCITVQQRFCSVQRQRLEQQTGMTWHIKQLHSCPRCSFFCVWGGVMCVYTCVLIQCSVAKPVYSLHTICTHIHVASPPPQVPLSVDLVQVVPQLVYLRDVEGMVDLALRVWW